MPKTVQKNTTPPQTFTLGKGIGKGKGKGTKASHIARRNAEKTKTYKVEEIIKYNTVYTVVRGAYKEKVVYDKNGNEKVKQEPCCKSSQKLAVVKLRAVIGQMLCSNVAHSLIYFSSQKDRKTMNETDVSNAIRCLMTPKPIGDLVSVNDKPSRRR